MGAGLAARRRRIAAVRQMARTLRAVRRPDPRLLAVAAEPLLWKRWIRALWCAVLILCGRLSVLVAVALSRPSIAPALFTCRAPLGRLAPALLPRPRAPPACSFVVHR